MFPMTRASVVTALRRPSLQISLVFALAFGAQASAQQAPPATDVFVASLTVAADRVEVGKPENISNSPGYDNQPFFAPDGRRLYFTSARGDVSSKCGSPQTDVYTYDLQSRDVRRVTETADCEYSPTVTPDGKHLSVIQVEPDGTQRLWKFTIDGKNPSVLLQNVKPVGYHAWLDQNTLVLFVLGQPATLQIADARTGQADIVASNVGQSIQRMPGGGVTFIQQSGDGNLRSFVVSQVVIENGKPVTRPLMPVVSGARQTHVAWTPDGTLLMAHEGTLYAWKQGQAEWRAAADLGALGLRNVTRLAVSPRGDRIAIVAAQ
jgi:dipeptidyl aminopeptidase/acylaminoacyl peptidase